MTRFVKPVNALASGYAFLISTVTGIPSVSAWPVSVSAELTNHCNLSCPECSSGSGLMKRERGFMDLDLFRKAITELKPYIYYLNLYFQGEPMLHPQFFSFLEQSKGITTTVSTNGHFLSAENAGKLVSSGLKRLIVSLDGMDQETYSGYRKNGDFEEVIRGIRNVSEAKKKNGSDINIEIQFLVNKSNEHQIASVRRFAGEVNGSLRLKSMQVIKNEDIEKWIPARNDMSRYVKNNGEYVPKNSFPNRCMRLWFNPVITWDGKVIPCCFDKDAEYVMGNLIKDSFRKIWNGQEYTAFRRQLLNGRKQIGICRSCTSGLKGVRY